jgi:hypothetical protein
VAIGLSAGAPAAEASLTEADLLAALPPVEVRVGSHITSLGSLVNTAARHRTVCTGPVMSNWIYRQPVAGNSHLVVWIDVRLYKGGSIEVFPWIENAYFLEPGPTNFVVSCSVTIGGTQRFSQSIDIKHHTRIPLLSGSNFSYWIGADPAITPRHDRAYFMATGMVPTYLRLNPSITRLNALLQTYTPNTLAGVDFEMGSAGNSGSLIHSSQALYITTGGDARAYRAALVFGLSSGSWPIHYRDGAGEMFSFLAYPSASIAIQESPVVPVGTGGVNGNYAVTHLMGFGYLPFLITGRWWFLDECLFWNGGHYLGSTVNQRRGGSGLGSDFIVEPTRSNSYNRGAHWAIARLSQALAILPTSHPRFPDIKNAWERNCAYYEGKFVLGTILQSGLPFVSPQGFLGDAAEGGFSLYHSRIADAGKDPGNHWWGAAWMSAFACQAWGHASELGLTISTQAQASMLAVRNHAYKQLLQRADDGLNGRFNWRRFIQYDYPIGSDQNGLPPETLYTAAQSFAIIEAMWGVAPVPATEGLTLLDRYTNNDLRADTSSSEAYGAQQVSGLAFARTHAVPGSVDAWRRITTASNFNSALGSQNQHDYPEHAIGPRL